MSDTGLALGLRRMCSAIVHGISNQRGGHDSFYVLFNSKRKLPHGVRAAFEFLLPYIDASLRCLPISASAELVQEEEPAAITQHALLSKRESEIMVWVKRGKTNQEIAMILDISVFTVKNRLHNLFKKLDVLNRAQAVAMMGAATDADS